MAGSEVFEALVSNQPELVESLLRSGLDLSEGEFEQLTLAQKALYKRIKAKIANDRDYDYDEEEPSAPRP